jgi:hypothetical protein
MCPSKIFYMKGNIDTIKEVKMFKSYIVKSWLQNSRVTFVTCNPVTLP